MLQFDTETARLLEEAYQGADFALRRRANFDALAPVAGERIADLGCGNGMLTLDLSRAVGDTGQVYALDPSDDMLKSARARCAGRQNVTLSRATAEATGLKDASLDKAVAIQVFEYLPDLPAALSEAARILRPGGLLVVGDIHFGTFAFASDDPDRMRRMMAAWDRHLANRAVPADLPALLPGHGFVLQDLRPHTSCDATLRPDGLARMMLHLMAGYARQNALLPEPEIAAWAAEQTERAAAGRFFHSLTHFVTVARRH